MLYKFNYFSKSKPEQEELKDKIKKICAAIVCVAVLVGGVTIILSLVLRILNTIFHSWIRSLILL